MDGWQYNDFFTEFLMSRKFEISLWTIGLISLFLAIIYFIDGVKKYGFSERKNEKQ